MNLYLSDINKWAYLTKLNDDLQSYEFINEDNKHLEELLKW